MAVSNPHHLGEGRRMLVRTRDSTAIRATRLHNDVAKRCVRREGDEGADEVVAYAGFLSAGVFLAA